MRASEPIDQSFSRLIGPAENDSALRVRTVAKDDSIEVWLYRGEWPLHRYASLSKDLVADVERNGQHLLENAGNDAPRCIERSRCSRAHPGLGSRPQESST